MPNSSARCAQLPRAVDKVPFYEALKKFKDYLNGSIDQIEEEDLILFLILTHLVRFLYPH